MKATITNKASEPKGVTKNDNFRNQEFIQPGETKTVDVHDEYVEKIKAVPFFDIEWAPEKPAAKKASK